MSTLHKNARKTVGVNDAYVYVSITTLVELSVAQAKESKLLLIKFKYLHIQMKCQKSFNLIFKVNLMQQKSGKRIRAPNSSVPGHIDGV
jgi:hypothetical protein